MTSQYKALLVDFDGCLAGPSLNVSPGVKEAIKKIRGDFRVSIASGRSALGIVARVIDELHLAGPHVLSGGATIYDGVTKQYIWKSLIAPSEVAAIIRYVEDHQLDGFFEETDACYTNIPRAKWKDHNEMDYRPIEELPNRDVFKIFIAVPATLKKLTETEEAISHAFKDLKVTKSISLIKDQWMGGIDIGHATKLEGVVEYLRITGLDHHQLIGIGDSYNDFPLLMAAGLKVAMGNAVEDLKAIADYVAPSVDNDGVTDVIEKYIL